MSFDGRVRERRNHKDLAPTETFHRYKPWCDGATFLRHERVEGRKLEEKVTLIDIAVSLGSPNIKMLVQFGPTLAESLRRCFVGDLHIGRYVNVSRLWQSRTGVSGKSRRKVHTRKYSFGVCLDAIGPIFPTTKGGGGKKSERKSYTYKHSTSALEVTNLQ